MLLHTQHPFPALAGWTFGFVPDIGEKPLSSRVYPVFYRTTPWGVLAVTHAKCDAANAPFHGIVELVDVINSMIHEPGAHQLSEAHAFVEDDEMETGFRYLGMREVNNNMLDTFALGDPDLSPEYEMQEPLRKHWWLYPAACFYRDHRQPFQNNPVADILLPRSPGSLLPR